MKKQLTVMTLSGLVAFNGIAGATQAHAMKRSVDNMIENHDNKSIGKVYVSSKKGNSYTENGSFENPYTDINTALDKAKNGDVLVILDTVYYTKYKTDQDNAALPLFINKNITIEGYDESSSFILRAPIQLGADVTFKNLNLEMVPETILGGRSGETDSRIFGGGNIPRAATIFAAGHELTLDNVNTRVGTNADQDEDRPYISGGTYKKNDDNMGEKTIINIVNPNSNTKFYTIYAGDYWTDRQMDVEINIDENTNLVDKTIYLGGVDHDLHGKIDINMKGQNDVTNIDKTNYIGDVNVTLRKGKYSTKLSLPGINNLILEENANLSVIENGKFDVKDIILKESSMIDFRKMTEGGNEINNNPIIRGNFKGVENKENIEDCATILVGNTQTVEVSGEVSGITRLNVSKMYINKFAKDHEYVRASLNSSGDFSIEGSSWTSCRLEKNKNEKNISWITIVEGETFGDFEWVDGEDEIVIPSDIDNIPPYSLEYVYPIKFIDDEGDEYIPEFDSIDDDFTYTLENKDGIMDVENGDISINWGFGEYYELILCLESLDNIDDLYGDIILTVTHKDGKKLTRTISIVEEPSELKKLTGTVDITGEAIEGKTIYADISKLPEDCKNLKYTWYVDDKEVQGKNKRDFELSSEHVGKSIKVKVEASNYDGYILSKAVEVKKKEESNPDTSIPPAEDKKDEIPGGNESDKDDNKEEGPDEGEGNPDEGGNGDGSPGNGGTVEKPEENNPGKDDKEETPDNNEKYDKTELKKLYDKCIGAEYKKSDFTQSSFKVYENALKKADEVLNDVNSTQSEIDNALKELQKAVDGLKKNSGSGSSGGGGSSTGGSSSSGGGCSSSGGASSGSNESSNNNQTSSDSNKDNTDKENSEDTSNKKTDWNLKDGKWYIELEDGSNAKGWYKDESSGKWYMLDKDTGAMMTGWYKDDNGKWYHLNDSGAMNTGWYKDKNEKWYRLDNSGAMVTGWYKSDNGKWYHLDDTGAMNTGWYKDSTNKWYYLNSDGSMAVNTTINGYKIGADGVWIK